MRIFKHGNKYILYPKEIEIEIDIMNEEARIHLYEMSLTIKAEIKEIKLESIFALKTILEEKAKQQEQQKSS